MFVFATRRLGILLPVIAIITDAYGWTNGEWKDAIVEFYSKFTKELNKGNASSEFLELYAEDPVNLWPQFHSVRKEDLLSEEDKLMERYSMDHEYVALVELLFSSSEVAVTRAVEYTDFVGGRQTKANGLAVFVRNEDGVKMKLNIFNFV